MLVSLQDAKDYLRIEHTEEDALLTSMLSAAIASVADNTNRTLEKKEVTETFPASVCRGGLHLAKAPAAIVSVLAVNEDDSTEVIEHDTRNLDFRPVVVVEDARKISVSYSAGYEVGELPAPLRQAILFTVAHFYENRLPVSSTSMHEVPMSVEYLLAPYRITFLA